MIDWYSESKTILSFFYDDETHLNESGRTAYAKYIASGYSIRVVITLVLTLLFL